VTSLPSHARARVGARRSADGPRDDHWALDFRPGSFHPAMQVLRVCAVCAFSSPPAFPPCSCPLHLSAPVRRLTSRISSQSLPDSSGIRCELLRRTARYERMLEGVGYSRRGNRSPRLGFRTVRERFPSHGSSVIHPLSWAPFRACDLHVGASSLRIIHPSLTGGLMASAALLVPLTYLSPSPRQHIRELSSPPWLLGESFPHAVSG
jgi:hypothetical protein